MESAIWLNEKEAVFGPQWIEKCVLFSEIIDPDFNSTQIPSKISSVDSNGKRCYLGHIFF